MEVIRTGGDFELIYDPIMRMFRIVRKEVSELSLWFDSEIVETLKEMSEEDFILTAKEYIHHAHYTD